MSLTQEQIKKRDGKLTASRVGVLMGGDPSAIHNLWLELIGDPNYMPEDLSGVWPVQLGSCTETLHLDWYERQTGRSLAGRGAVIIHPKAEWAAATLDGFDEELNAPVETKHVNAFSKMPDVVGRYMPQLHWQMLCTSTYQSVLSVIFGAAEPQQQTVPYDISYGNQLWARAEQFMHCVETLTQPVALPQIVAPVPVSEFIEKDMSGNNAWAVHAEEWSHCRDHAKRFEKAGKELKALMEPNYGRAYGYGIEISRSKAGSLTIRGEKS